VSAGGAKGRPVAKYLANIFSLCNSGIHFGVSRHMPGGLLRHMRVTGQKNDPASTGRRNEKPVNADAHYLNAQREREQIRDSETAESR